MIDPRREARFTPEPLACDGVVDGLPADHFQRERPSEAIVHGIVDDPHSSFTKLADDAVSADLVREDR